MMKSNKFLEEQLYNGKTIDEILRSSMTRQQMADILGVGIGSIAVMRRNRGLTKPYKPHLGSLKHRNVDYLLTSLVCPRCKDQTKNKQEGAAIYYENTQADGSRCMYHYTQKEYDRAKKSLRQGGAA